MKIKMYSNYAGPKGVMVSGKEYPVDEKTAVELVDAGYAEYAEPIPAVFNQEPVEAGPQIEQQMMGGRKKVRRGAK